LYFAREMEKPQDSRQETLINVYCKLNAYCHLLLGIIADSQLNNENTNYRYKRYMLHSCNIYTCCSKFDYMKIISLFITLLFLFGCDNSKSEINSGYIIGSWVQDSTNRIPHKNEHKKILVYQYRNDGTGTIYTANKRQGRIYENQFKNYKSTDTSLTYEPEKEGGLIFPDNFGEYRLIKKEPNNLILIAKFNTTKVFYPEPDSIIYLSRVDKPKEFLESKIEIKPISNEVSIAPFSKLKGFWKKDSTENKSYTSIHKYNFLQFDKVENDSSEVKLTIYWTGKRPNSRISKVRIKDGELFVKEEKIPFFLTSDSQLLLKYSSKAQFHAEYYSKINPKDFIPDSLIK